MRPTPDWPVRDLLAHRASTTPAAQAVVDADTGRTWTYRDLDRLVDRAAARVSSRLGSATAAGGPFDRPTVALAASTTVEFTVGLFATWRAGAVAVPLDVTAPDSVLEERLDDVGASLLVVTDPSEPWGSVADGRQMLSLADVAEADPSTRGQAAAVDEAAEWAPAEPALVCFTSGTTGSPKGVLLSHRNLVSSAYASASRLGLARDERWLDCLPTNHVGGVAPLVRSACYGSTAVLQRGFDRDATADAIAEHAVTAVSLVPTQLRRLLDDGWTPPDALRVVLLGGAPAGDELLARARDATVPVSPTYGTTETASQIATLPPDASAAANAVGPPLVVADVTIVEPGTERPLDTGEVGELVVDGPIVSQGYLHDAATTAAFGEFGLHTGDLASRDERGRLTIHGRLDDAIQTGGETVHPWRVADVLESHPAVDAAAVVGVPDPEWGERVAAMVVSVDDESLDRSSLVASCRADLASHEVPKTVQVVDRLPRTASGTVDRDAAREALAGSGSD